MRAFILNKYAFLNSNDSLRRAQDVSKG